MSPRRNQFRTSAHTARRANALAAVAAITGAAACGGKDPYAPTASLPTYAVSYTIFPLSRVRAPFYPALDLHTPNAVRPAVQSYLIGSTYTLVPNFDVAFDLDSAGHIVLLQPKQIVTTTTVPKTGFQTSTTAFDALGSAPGGTYQQDSLVRVSPKQTVIVQAQGLACLSAGTFFYAKLVVDSITAAGALATRVVTDPNCGFKSFASGVPTS